MHLPLGLCQKIPRGSALPLRAPVCKLLKRTQMWFLPGAQGRKQRRRVAEWQWDRIGSISRWRYVSDCVRHWCHRALPGPSCEQHAEHPARTCPGRGAWRRSAWLPSRVQLAIGRGFCSRIAPACQLFRLPAAVSMPLPELSPLRGTFPPRCPSAIFLLPGPPSQRRSPHASACAFI